MITTAPVAPANRPRTLMVGTMFATSAALMFFGGLFSIYLSVRSDTLAWGAEWFPEGAISLLPGGMNMATMALSAVTMAWAVYSILNNDRVHAYLAILVTGILGVAVINQTAFYFMDIAIPVDYNEAAVLFYVIIGAHLVMVGLGVFWLGLLLLRTLGGQDTAQHRDLVSSAALYWYATVAVYSFIWLFIYIGK
ncbi:MAG: cytochrome c oxidase subunit 3 [Acidimicrobiales bacterium]|nr:cytochrome c oxidase subunit 3 [Acidimicrobiales bacterium]